MVVLGRRPTTWSTSADSGGWCGWLQELSHWVWSSRCLFLPAMWGNLSVKCFPTLQSVVVLFPGNGNTDQMFHRVIENSILSERTCCQKVLSLLQQRGWLDPSGPELASLRLDSLFCDSGGYSSLGFARTRTFLILIPLPSSKHRVCAGLACFLCVGVHGHLDLLFSITFFTLPWARAYLHSLRHRCSCQHLKSESNYFKDVFPMLEATDCKLNSQCQPVFLPSVVEGKSLAQWSSDLLLKIKIES